MNLFAWPGSRAARRPSRRVFGPQQFAFAALLWSAGSLVGCGEDEPAAPAPRGSRLNVDSGIEVPTQEEANRAAAEKIDRRNFDAELQKIEQEIENDR